jgi:hypothetical protein
LPCGLADQLAEPDAGHLLLFRAETLDGQECPYGVNVDRKAHPIVCRIRNLVDQSDVKLLQESLALNARVHTSAALCAGRVFVVSGKHVDETQTNRLILAFDALTGTRRWSRASTISPSDHGCLFLGDQASCYMGIYDPDVNPIILVDARSGTDSRTSPPGVEVGSVELGFYAAGRDHGGFTIMDADLKPLVSVGIDAGICSPPCFDHSGNRFAWGNTDGTVTVCDLPRIRIRLSEIGLGW